jgi:hypothetical protein
MASRRDTQPQPTVLHPIELASFIQRLLEHHAPPTNLIICSTEDAFLWQLNASTEYEIEQERQEAANEGLEPERVQRIASRSHPLAIATIHQISTSRTITVTFCSTLPQLQAYLAVHGVQKTAHLGRDDTGIQRTGLPTLALLNPLQLHRGTSSFSAQGLSRTFASSVEAAVRAGQKLLIVECPSRVPETVVETTEHEDFGDDDQGMLDAGVGHDESGETRDPWEQQVAILNVTTKSFGAGERGWVGRTVKIRRVVERWCVFA